MWFWAIVALGFLVIGFIRWPQGEWLQTDISALLPSVSDNPWLAQATASATSAYENQLVLMVEGDDHDKVARFLQDAGERLQAAGFVDTGFEKREADKWRALSERLYPYRWNLLAAEDRAGLQKSPAAYLQEFRRKLYSPMGIALTSSLNSDPAGLYRNFFEAAVPTMAAGSGGIAAAVPVVEIAVYQAVSQQQGLGRTADLYSMYRVLKSDADRAGLGFYATGAALYSAFGMHSAEVEISTIGLASLLLLVLLLVAILRSLHAILLTLLCVSSGVVGGLLVTVSLLQQIHIVTLVFGATIIGIAADYAFHYLAHSLVPGWRREHALDKVWVGLSLAFVSSATAFLGLTLLPFPGIRQIGLFMAGGLLFSFVTVCVLFPIWYRGANSSARLPRFFKRSQFTVRAGVSTLLVLAVVAIPGLTLLHGKDEVREFYALPDALQNDQSMISRAVSAAPNSRFLLIRERSTEDLLSAEEQLMRKAELLVQRGDSVGLSGVSRLIPSTAVQRKNFALLRTLIDGGYLGAHLDALGFDSKSKNELLAGVPQAFKAIDVDELQHLENPVLPMGLGGFLGCIEGECASWVQVSGKASSQAVAELAASNSSVELIDPVADINALLADYRAVVAKLLIAGGMVITLLMMLVFGWRVGLSILLLPLISCVMSLATIGYIHHSYNIVNLLALLLILGVSLDYAVFRVFTPEPDQPATSLAIALSSLTSILAFGMLAFSQTPVISAFGQTIAIGLLFTYGLSWVRFEWSA